MSDTRRAFLELAKQIEPSLRKAFLDAFFDIKSSARMRALEAALERGDIEGVIQALNLRDEFFAPLDRAISDAFYQGGVYQLANLPGKPPPDIRRLEVRFSGRNPRAEAWVRDRAGTLITRITEGQRQAVRAAVAEGIESGMNPRQMALTIAGRVQDGKRVGGIVGLTEPHARAVMRYRAELEQAGTSAADVALKVQRYSNRLLRLRGEMIARTETIAALNEARREAMQQMIDAGHISERAVTRVWDATGDARTREDHLAMEGQTVRWGQPFIAPDGSLLMGPGDNSFGAAADQIIGCRCYEQIKVDYLAAAV